MIICRGTNAQNSMLLPSIEHDRVGLMELPRNQILAQRKRPRYPSDFQSHSLLRLGIIRILLEFNPFIVLSVLCMTGWIYGVSRKEQDGWDPSKWLSIRWLAHPHRGHVE